MLIIYNAFDSKQLAMLIFTCNKPQYFQSDKRFQKITNLETITHQL